MTTLMTFTSTRQLHNGPASTMLALQAELIDRQRELASGRKADIGLALGAGVKESLALRDAIDAIETQRRLNGLVGERFATAQSALAGMVEGAHDLISTALGARAAENGAGLMRQKARDLLADFTVFANASTAGVHVFGGLATDRPPIADLGPGSAMMTAMDDAFRARFGFGPDDPAAATVSAADMTAFLDSDIAPMFSAAGWKASASSATDETPDYLLGDMTANGRVSANAEGIRLTAEATSIIAAFGSEALAPGTFTALIDRATAKANGGVAALADAQTRVGLAEERVRIAEDRLDGKEIRSLSGLEAREGVDPYETSTRINTLITAIETSYALTGRLQALSLMNYLR